MPAYSKRRIRQGHVVSRQSACLPTKSASGRDTLGERQPTAHHCSPTANLYSPAYEKRRKTPLGKSGVQLLQHGCCWSVAAAARMLPRGLLSCPACPITPHTALQCKQYQRQDLQHGCPCVGAAPAGSGSQAGHPRLHGFKTVLPKFAAPRSAATACGLAAAPRHAAAAPSTSDPAPAAASTTDAY